MQVMGDFFYHLYRKLSRQEYRRILALLDGKANAASKAEAGKEAATS